jgi:hypothetical protein
LLRFWLRWLGRVCTTFWLVDARLAPFTNQMPARSNPDMNLPGMGREGTNCNYCNGAVRHGSRNKTPYIVGISPAPRLLAHAMQQSQAFQVNEDEGGENRESNFSLAQRRIPINREIVPSLSVTPR